MDRGKWEMDVEVDGRRGSVGRERCDRKRRGGLRCWVGKIILMEKVDLIGERVMEKGMESGLG